MTDPQEAANRHALGCLIFDESAYLDDATITNLLPIAQGCGGYPFEEPDQDRKPRLAAVELKLRLMRERVVVRGRN